MGRCWKILKFWMLLLSAISLSSCGKTEGVAPSDSFVSGLTISPASVTLAVNNTLMFTASGGSGSIVFSIFSGVGSIDSVTGLYTAPGSAGSATVRATDALGNTSSATVIITTNATPVISAVAAQTANEDAVWAVNFTISDADSVLNCASSVSVSTSNAGLLPLGNIVFSGVAPNCTATLTPQADQSGVSNLILTVTDTETQATSAFSYTVNSVNDAPEISNILAQNVKSDASLVVNYTISDVDSALDCSASVTVVSGSAGVLPDGDIVKGGSAPNCTLSVSPSLNVAGVSNVSVAVSDGVLTDVSLFNLSVINVASVGVVPGSLSVGVGALSQLTATAHYSDASAAVITSAPGTAWASSASGIALVDNAASKGLTSGVAEGTANVSATYKGVASNNSSVTVIAATSVSVSIGSVSGGIGGQGFISATAQSSSSTFDVTNTAVWTTSNATVATVSSGVISYVAAGSAIITASYAGLTADVNVTVLNKSLVSISVTAAGGGSSLPLDGTINMIATATYSDASTDILTSAAVWSSSNTSVLIMSNALPYVGRATGLAGGTSTVTAAVGAVSGNILMTVNDVTLTSIAVTPDDALVASGSNYNLRATGTYSDASTSDITDLVTWASTDGSAATISNTAGSKGVASTPVFAGYRSTSITATLASVVGSTTFGVNGATISSIMVTPMVTLTAGETYPLKSYANLSDGGVVDLSEFSIWSSGTVGNVSISNSAGSKGLVTGIANGTSAITAQFNGSSGNRTVTVAGSSALTEVGIGLTGTYFTWTGGAPPASPFLPVNEKGKRIDAKINFAWGAGNAPMGVGNLFSVRWTGFYKATSATNYFCSYSDDGVRVWIDGVLLVNNWTEHGPTWNCSANVPLTVGTKYSVVYEYYENGGGSEAHLTRSSVSAADAQNTTTRIVPQNDLFPE